MSAAAAALAAAFVVALGAASGAPHGPPRGVDLTVRSLSTPPASVERGARFTAVLTVANVGTRRAPRSTVAAYLSRAARRGKGDVLVGRARPVPPLRPGKAKRRVIVAKIPRATSTGLWFLIVCSDDTRVVREANDRNNCRRSTRRTSVTATGSPPAPPPPTPPAPPPPSPPPPSPPPPANPPAPIAGQGYTLRFDDEFTTLNRSVWDDHIWYDEAPIWPNFQYVENGVLLLVSRRSDLYPGCSWNCYPQNTVTTQSAGIRFRRGYFEARMKWTKGRGSWPAFWLLSYAHATNPNWPEPACPNPHCLAAELDVMEGQGSSPNDFYGTIHRNSANYYGAPDEQNENNWQPQSIDLTAGFHTYAALWTATTVSWYLDDRFLMSAPVYDSFNQDMFLLLSMWSGGWEGDPDSSTPDELRTEVDWVRVWQK